MNRHEDFPAKYRQASSREDFWLNAASHQQATSSTTNLRNRVITSIRLVVPCKLSRQRTLYPLRTP
jgi:hypothetical protein